MTLIELWGHCGAIAPELILSAAICAIVVVDMLTPLARSRSVCHALATAGVVAALVTLAGTYGRTGGADFRGMIAADRLTQTLRLLILLGALGSLLFSARSRELEPYRQGEYTTLLLGAVLGALFLVAADHWALFVLGLETLSLCSYVLAGYLKHRRTSAEAALKYMLYGAVISGVMLFGIGYLYGMSGTLAIGAGMRAAADAGGLESPVFLLALLLVLAGLGFKMAMVPFQFWAPDVYQGAPTPVTAFLAVVSKLAGFGALMRVGWPLLEAAVPPQAPLLLFGLLAAVTMTFGNLVALRQTDVKRLLAYSSIAHAGYLLMGMAVWKPAAFEVMLAYFFIYVVMNLGAFWVVIAVVNRTGRADLAAFDGLRLTAPALCWTMFVFLVSLTGLPPTAGFSAKFMLFGAVVREGLAALSPQGALTPMAAFYLGLALVGVLNSVVSLYYYMKIAYAMAFQPPPTGAPVRSEPDWGYAVLLAIPTVLLLDFRPVLHLVRLG